MAPNERFSISVQSAVDPNASSLWWANEDDLLAGGGAIHAVEDGYRFEINHGLRSIPVGEATWQVFVVLDEPDDQPSVSERSESRSICRRQ